MVVLLQHTRVAGVLLFIRTNEVGFEDATSSFRE
jgi:hypothetical protein